MTHTTNSPVLDDIPVFYSDRMVVDITSFSPSAWKPMDVMQSWQALEIPLRVVAPVCGKYRSALPGA